MEEKNKKIRIGHYMPQYGTNTGTGQVLEKLVDLLRGHKFIELVIFKYGDENVVNIEQNVTIVSFLHSRSKLLPPLKFLKIIRNNKYNLDSLGIHMPFSPQNFFTYLFSGVCIDYYPHGCFAPKTLNRQGKKIKKNIYLNLIEKIILKHTRKIICATSRESLYMNNLGFENTSVAHFPFTLPVLKKNFNNSFRKTHNFSDNDFLIVFVGRYDIYTKGLDVLVKAVKNVNEVNPKIKAVLIGYNIEKPTALDNLIIENDSENCVFNLGPLYNEEKYDALLSSNLYVQASRYESFGVSILEPLSLKIPCLLSIGCDISPSVYKANGCYQFDGSIDALVAEILSIYNNPNNSIIIGENGFNWINNNLDARTLLHTWEDAYNLN